MARSENQGLQIAVIIFAFLTIALSVATFYFFNDASTQYAAALDQTQKAAEKDTTLRQEMDQVRVLKELIGVENEITLAATQTKRDEVILPFSGLPQVNNSKTLIAVLNGLKGTMDQWNQERQDQKKKLEDSEKALRALEARYAADVKKAVDTYVAENTRLMRENTTLAAKDDELANKLKDVGSELQTKKEELVKAGDDNQKALLAKDKEIASVRAQMAQVIKERYELDNQVFERPDAMIVSLNAKEQTVNINVGRSDYLRLNIHFGVFKRGETNVYHRTKKGTIAVTRFIGENLAEARIVDSNLKDPMLAGDVIFTPTWTPGTQETFVLAGDFDINGDRKPDNDLMRTLVDINGGKVQEEVGIDTRYLLLGDAPPASDKDNREKYEKRKARAKELSIKVMGLPEFIEYTGSLEMIKQLQKLGSKEDVNKILKVDKRQLSQGGFRTREREGGLRREEPGSAPRATSGENTNKFPPRRPGGID
jgi:hypothetical protein